MKTDTIAAIATPLGEGGIGIIRMSGPDCLTILTKVWSGKRTPREFQTHHLYHGWIVVPQQPQSGVEGACHSELRSFARGEQIATRAPIIDEVMACWMRSPHSYTGEDIVEISGHGSPFVMQEGLSLLLRHGARAAEPGEFTKRAFLNGRIDLTQAEAVAAMIGARSEAMRRLAERGLEGELKKTIEGLRHRLIESLGKLEADIDFPEEDPSPDTLSSARTSLEIVSGQITTLLKNYDEGKAFREGVSVAIVGRPNVGKSSLLNRLAGRDRAIVHHEPGTTRDTIEAEIKWEGILFRLVDTAGLRIDAGTVEQQGIDRARRAQAEAYATVAVIDQSTALTVDDLEILGRLNPGTAVIALNKMDLPGAVSEREAAERAPSVPMLPVSAKTGVGLERLQNEIVRLVTLGPPDAGSGGIFNIRHRDLLTKARAVIGQALRSLLQGESPEFASSLIRQGANHLAEVTGEVTTEEILGEIFSKFCIGK